MKCSLYSTDKCEYSVEPGYSVHQYQIGSTSRTVARTTSVKYISKKGGSAVETIGMRASEKCTWVIRTQTGAPTIKVVAESGYKIVNTQSTTA